MRNQVSHALLKEIESLPVVDSHEHLMPLQARSERARDFSYLFSQYAGPEMVSAGMPPGELDLFYSSQVAEDEKVALFLPCWNRIRNTSLARVKREAAGRFFNVERFDEEGLMRLGEAIRRSARPDWYERVLGEGGIEAMVVNYLKTHRSLGWETVEEHPRYRYTADFDDFLWIASRSDIESLEAELSTPVRSLDDLLEGLAGAFEKRIGPRTAALKTVLAYVRTLAVEEEPDRGQARQAFRRLLERPGRPFDPKLRGQHVAWARPLQDLLLHRICESASGGGLPLQVHVGYQAGNSNVLANSDPRLLTPLLMRYPRLDFELMHAGYPYHLSSVALAKMFPNAYLNLSWIYTLAPQAARETLEHAVEMVPACKIVGFGADSRLVESLAVHLDWARRAMAEVLGARVANALMTASEAVDFARWILWKAPSRLYRLGS